MGRSEVLGLLLVVLGVEGEEQKKPPNIVLIVIDDLGNIMKLYLLFIS